MAVYEVDAVKASVIFDEIVNVIHDGLPVCSVIIRGFIVEDSMQFESVVCSGYSEIGPGGIGIDVVEDECFITSCPPRPNVADCANIGNCIQSGDFAEEIGVVQGNVSVGTAIRIDDDKELDLRIGRETIELTIGIKV